MSRWKPLVDAARELVLNPMNKEARAEVEYIVNWKVCASCSVEKHISDFDRDTKSTDGCRSKCKECRSEEKV